MKPILLVFILLVSGCFSFRPPHGVWKEPALQVQGRIAGASSPSDSILAMRAPHFSVGYRDRPEDMRLVLTRLEGDSTGLRPESFPRRVARLSEGGRFSVSFPPAERYGGLPPSGGWYWSDEAVLIRVGGESDRVFAIELAPPRRAFVVEGADTRPATEGEIRVEAVEEDPVLPDSTATLVLEVDIL